MNHDGLYIEIRLYVIYVEPLHFPEEFRRFQSYVDGDGLPVAFCDFSAKNCREKFLLFLGLSDGVVFLLLAQFHNFGGDFRNPLLYLNIR